MSDIPKLVLDPQNETEMLAQMLARTRAASGNTLTDFSPGSPVTAIAEGQVYATAELLWFLNQLPEATALEVLRLSGVSRSPGTYAKGTLAVLLRSPLSSAFTIPQGYSLSFRDRSYELTEPLYIPPGAVEGRVKARAKALGSQGNVAAYGLSNLNPGLNYVQSVYNPEAFTGGSDLEPLEDTIRRSQEAVRDRQVLVSVGDYEGRAQQLLGTGSKAWGIPLLSSDRITRSAGQLHLFLLDATGEPPNTATCQAIQQSLLPLSPPG